MIHITTVGHTNNIINRHAYKRKHLQKYNENKTYFFSELVMRRWVSWFSSNNSIAPKYPSLLSANLGEATSFRHSI